MSSFGCANPSSCPFGGKCDYGCSMIVTPKKKTGVISKKIPAQPKFKKGDRVNLVSLLDSKRIRKSGVIEYLLANEYERKSNHSRGEYHYMIKYDDGTYGRYEYEKFLRHY